MLDESFDTGLLIRCPMIGTSSARLDRPAMPH